MPLDLPDIEANDEETSENMWGNKVVYRRASMTADDNYDFSVEFRDTRYLDVYMYFRLYDLYENRKSLGLAQPNKKYIYNFDMSTK